MVDLSARTWLYVPGDRPDRLASSRGTGADALIWDLEDAVAPDAKATARAAIAAALADVDGAGPPVWVRVNNQPTVMADDLDAVVGPGLAGVFFPKVEDLDQLAALDVRLDAAERGAGLVAGSVPVVAMIESARGVRAAADLLGAPRVVGLAIGEGDLSADLGVPFADDSPLLAHIRAELLITTAAAGAHPPIGPVTFGFRDADAYRATCVTLARTGIIGRQIIHPAQIAPAHDVFTPSPDDVARARELVAAFDAADAAGTGVFTGPDGSMVDLAVVRGARRTLARAHHAP